MVFKRKKKHFSSLIVVFIGKECSKFTYDYFARIPEEIKTSQKLLSPESKTDKPKRKIKRKSRSKSKTKRSKSKSKSPKKTNK